MNLVFIKICRSDPCERRKRSNERKNRINWDYEGKPDFINGTGAYFEEKLLGYGASIVIPAFLLCFILTGQVTWDIFQIVLALLLAFDVGGGVVSNSLNSGKRFYHSAIKTEEGKLGYMLKNKWVFSVIHVHPLLISLFFGEGDWSYGLIWYPLFIASVFIMNATALYLKRPLSFFFILAAILMNFYVIAPVPGFEWLMPLLFLKIIYGHLVKEEPYRKVKLQP